MLQRMFLILDTLSWHRPNAQAWDENGIILYLDFLYDEARDGKFQMRCNDHAQAYLMVHTKIVPDSGLASFQLQVMTNMFA